MTEVGLLLGIREFWPDRHDLKPIEQLGSAIANGNGAEAVALTVALVGLGYRVALFRDSDVPLTADEMAKLGAAGVPVFEYGNLLNTEQAIFYAASELQVQRLIDHAREERGVDPINDSIFPAIGDMDRASVAQDFATWELVHTALNGQQLRERLAEVACRKKWFKDARISRDIAPIVWSIAEGNQASPLATALARVEGWLYA